MGTIGILAKCKTGGVAFIFAQTLFAFQYSTKLLQLPLHAAHYRAPLQPGDSRQRCDHHSDRIRKLKLQHLPNLLTLSPRVRYSSPTRELYCPDAVAPAGSLVSGGQHRQGFSVDCPGNLSVFPVEPKKMTNLGCRAGSRWLTTIRGEARNHQSCRGSHDICSMSLARFIINPLQPKSGLSLERNSK